MFETRIAPAGVAGVLSAADAWSQAISDFQRAVAEDGFPAGLRTYAPVMDFRLYAADQAPMSVADAIAYLSEHRVRGAWIEAARGRSDAFNFAYAVGELGDAAEPDRSAYVEIWRYDPKVANWGLSVLLISPLGERAVPSR